MSLDSLEETLLFRQEVLYLAPMQQPPYPVTEEGSDEPPEKCRCERGDAHGDERIGRNGFGNEVGHFGVDRNGESAASGRSDGGEQGEGERVAASRGTKLEECVPV